MNLPKPSPMHLEQALTENVEVAMIVQAQSPHHHTIQDDAIFSAWREQIEAVEDPVLKEKIRSREGELLPGFAAHYTVLSTLSRPKQQSLERQWRQPLAGVALLLALGPMTTVGRDLRCERYMPKLVTDVDRN